ncbi:phosphatase, putative [Eimeria necatrix]|uniref:Protein tyrosine phosphatase type IVA 3 n=1 Tax=Eimeria necatrix TaxID=51315 RepID=U6N1T4_9EIME|nr:phosphatase, putative [Eimeria necatrix]CDJ68709.1 phosphatase, putative [Eimeria necatrix]
MVFFSRMRREKRKCDGSSSFCCSKSETDSECSSLRQDVCDTLQPQQQLLAPSVALDQWSFPSCRSGLRTNNGNANSNGGHRLFSRLANHGAAFPAEVPRMTGRHNNGTLSQSRQENLCAAREAGTAAAAAHAQRCMQRSPTAGVPCCCCSDSSTQSGGSSELCRGRWCNAACSSGLLLQQQQDQLKPPQVPQQQQHAAGMVLNVPTLIESRGVKCLILDAPTNENLQAYLAQLVQVGVTDLVRTCPPTYDEAPVVGAGIRMHDLTFPDGEAPPDEVIARWRALAAQAKAEGGVLAVHCVAGLGRGPVLVAVSLIDSGLEAEEAVNFIRSRRKGAINRRQLAFLHSYRRHAVASRRCIKGCNIM